MSLYFYIFIFTLNQMLKHLGNQAELQDLEIQALLSVKLILDAALCFRQPINTGSV